jgi:RimJ/RimL family protein N-acetyltransferase
MDQPIGEIVADTQSSPSLRRRELRGRAVRLREPEPRADTAALYDPTHGTPDSQSVWTYMGYGPFSDRGAMADWMTSAARSDDPLWFTVVDEKTGPVGMAALMNHDPAHRSLELGHIWYVPEAHRKGVNTEAAYLMLTEAFETYRCRRVEWKCDSLNAPSRHAALRLGFTFEGVFRNHMIVKGHNRDTAWYAMTDDEWPRVQRRLEEWLDHPDPKPSLSVATTG